MWGAGSTAASNGSGSGGGEGLSVSATPAMRVGFSSSQAEQTVEEAFLASANEITRKLHKLPLLKRRQELAKRYHTVRCAVIAREDNARAKGYASSAAMERASRLETKHLQSQGNNAAWGKDSLDAAKCRLGHKAYRDGQRQISRALEKAKLSKNVLPLSFLEGVDPIDKTNFDDDDNQIQEEEEKKEVHHQMGIKVALNPTIKAAILNDIREDIQTGTGLARETRVLKLKNKMDQVKSEWREQKEMRLEDFNSLVASLEEAAMGGTGNLEDSFNVAKHDKKEAAVTASANLQCYWSVVEDEICALNEAFGPRIASLQNEYMAEKQAASSGLATDIQHEWGRQLACFVYQQSCKRYGLTESRAALTAFGQEATELCNVQLCPRHLGALCGALGSTLGLKRLSFRENNIGNTGCRVLGKCFETTHVFGSLVCLELSHNNVSTAGANDVVQGLLTIKRRTLQRLSLAHNDIGKRGNAECRPTVLGSSLAALLGDREHPLAELDMSHNTIGETLGVALGRAIFQAPMLNNISLAFTSMGVKGRAAVLGACKGHPRLTELDLSFATLTDKDARLAASVLAAPDCPLLGLNMSGNCQIGQTGCVTLEKALRKSNRVLERLIITSCGFGIEGCRLLIDVLRENPVIEQLECDHRKCLYNPLCRDGTLEKLVYMGLATEAEFQVKVLAVDTLAALEARIAVRNSAYGHFFELPNLINPQFVTRHHCPALEECIPGFKCQVQAFTNGPGPWLNAKVLDVVVPSSIHGAEAAANPSQVRVELVDFLPEDGDELDACSRFDEYDPPRQWIHDEHKLDTPYPLVTLDKLRVPEADVAVLTVARVLPPTSNAPHAPIETKSVAHHNGEHIGQVRKILFPVRLLPPWMQKCDQVGYCKSCYLGAETAVDNITGPVFRVRQTTSAVKPMSFLFQPKSLSPTMAVPGSSLVNSSSSSSNNSNNNNNRQAALHSCPENVSLLCANYDSEFTSQTPFEITWPIEAFAPRPRLQKAIEMDEGGGDESEEKTSRNPRKRRQARSTITVVRPMIVDAKQKKGLLHRQATAAADEVVLFCFYKYAGSVTPCFRMLQKQNTR